MWSAPSQGQLVAGFLLAFYGCLETGEYYLDEDIIALRQRDPELAFARCHAMRGPLGSAPDAGCRAVGLHPRAAAFSRGLSNRGTRSH